MKENQTNPITQLTGCFLLAVALLFLGQAARAQQVVFDDATQILTNSSGSQYVLAVTNSDAIGDEIVLDPGAGNLNAVVVPGVSTNVVLTNFTFEYYLDENDGTVNSHTHATNYTYPTWSFDLKFYAMNGMAYGTNYNAPGVPIYDSGVQDEHGLAGAQGTYSGFHTLDMNLTKNGGVMVPLDFTWTVNFGGAALEANNLVGLPIFSTNGLNLVGSTYPAYWDNTGVAQSISTGSSTYTGTWLSIADGANIPMDFGADADASTAASLLPSVKIIAPKSKFTDGTNRLLTVTGTATLKSKIANNYIAEVLWNLNGTNGYGTNGWNTAAITAGVAATNWTAVVKLPVDGLGTAGVYGTTNAFAVEALDAAADVSVPVTNIYNFVSEQTATLNVAGAGTVKYGSGPSAVVFGSGNASGPIGPLIVGKKYTIAITQTNDNPISYYFSNIDYSYVDSTGSSQSGFTPASYGSKAASTNYTFLMESNTVLTVNFVANRFLAAAGTYNGLFYNTESGADLASAGYYTLTVNADKDRSYSGVLNFGGNAVKYPFKGTFALDGTATSVIAGVTNVSLALPFDNANDTVSGTLTSSEDGVNLNSSMLADRQIVSAATSFAGKYTVALVGAPGNTTNAPEGDATMTLAVDAVKGTATFNNLNFGNGKGTQLVPIVSTNGDIPFFARVNDNTTQGATTFDGIAIGWLTIDTNTADEVSGQLTWVHQTGANPLDTLTEGFTYQGNIEASPLSVQNPLITLSSGTATFAVEGGHQNDISASVPVVAADGWVYPVTNYVTTGVAPHTHVTAVPTPYSFVVAKPTGTFDGHMSGTFTNTAINPDVKFTWGGVVIQTHNEIRGGFDGGGGYGYVRIH